MIIKNDKKYLPFVLFLIFDELLAVAELFSVPQVYDVSLHASAITKLLLAPQKVTLFICYAENWLKRYLYIMSYYFMLIQTPFA